MSYARAMVTVPDFLFTWTDWKSRYRDAPISRQRKSLSRLKEAAGRNPVSETHRRPQAQHKHKGRRRDPQRSLRSRAEAPASAGGIGGARKDAECADVRCECGDRPVRLH